MLDIVTRERHVKLICTVGKILLGDLRKTIGYVGLFARTLNSKQAKSATQVSRHVVP